MVLMDWVMFSELVMTYECDVSGIEILGNI
jgi:hypothetical protein